MQISGSSIPASPTHLSTVRPAARPTQPQATTQATAPASPAPAKVDPRLWDVLTSDERNHFAEIGAMGPLSYGRTATHVAPAAPRGARLSVRG